MHLTLGQRRRIEAVQRLRMKVALGILGEWWQATSVEAHLAITKAAQAALNGSMGTRQLQDLDGSAVRDFVSDLAAAAALPRTDHDGPRWRDRDEAPAGYYYFAAWGSEADPHKPEWGLALKTQSPGHRKGVEWGSTDGQALREPMVRIYGPVDPDDAPDQPEPFRAP